MINFDFSFNRGNPGHVIGHSPNLTFAVSPNTVGEYVCRASVRGGEEEDDEDHPLHPSVTAVAAVYMKGPPRIILGGLRSGGERGALTPVSKDGSGGVPSAASAAASTASVAATAGEGEAARLTCRVFSVPPTEVVSWSHRGVDIEPSAAAMKYSVDETRSETGTTSVLTVRGVGEDDLGAYVCTAANAMGTDSAAMHLRRKGERKKTFFVKSMDLADFLHVANKKDPLIFKICKIHEQK